MADGDVIRLLSRYQWRETSNPKENRLTAVLAALLTESPKLANGFADLCTTENSPPAETTLVRTQRPVGGKLGWVDLELDVRQPRRKVVWIEAKLDSGLSGRDQLQKYVMALRRFAISDQAEKVVLLLVPAQAASRFPKLRSWRLRQEPDDLQPYLITWQDVYAHLNETSRRGLPAEVRWLMREVLGYMADEKLARTRLTQQHIKALHDFSEASTTAQAVVDQARELLAHEGWVPSDSAEFKRRYDPKSGYSHRDSPRSGYWQSGYVPERKGEKRTSTGAVIVWGIAPPVLFAGVRFHLNERGSIAPPADGKWCAALLATEERPEGADQWTEEPGDHRNELWVTCWQDLVTAANGKTADDQAKQIARFVSAAFSIAVSSRVAAKSQ